MDFQLSNSSGEAILNDHLRPPCSMYTRPCCFLSDNAAHPLLQAAGSFSFSFHIYVLLFKRDPTAALLRLWAWFATSVLNSIVTAQKPAPRPTPLQPWVEFLNPAYWALLLTYKRPSSRKPIVCLWDLVSFAFPSYPLFMTLCDWSPICKLTEFFLRVLLTHAQLDS